MAGEHTVGSATFRLTALFSGLCSEQQSTAGHTYRMKMFFTSVVVAFICEMFAGAASKLITDCFLFFFVIVTILKIVKEVHKFKFIHWFLKYLKESLISKLLINGGKDLHCQICVHPTDPEVSALVQLCVVELLCVCRPAALTPHSVPCWPVNRLIESLCIIQPGRWLRCQCWCSAVCPYMPIHDLTA